MYSNYYNYPIMSQPYTNQQNGDRFIAGGFIAPFLLGGLAGAALAAPRPYPYYPPYYAPVPYYPPYYFPPCC